MKLQIIETPDYVLAVCDEEIKEGYCVHPITKNISLHHNTDNNLKGWRKIIAYQPKGNARELDLPLLPEMVVEDDVEKLAENAYVKHEVKDDKLSLDEQIQRSGGFIVGFKAGYNAATKVYSEEDLRKAFYFGTNEGYNYRDLESADEEPEELSEEDWDNFVKNLKQPKTPKWFIAEMDCGEVRQCVCENNSDCLKPIFKTTTINGKTYLVGTYLNE